MHSNSSVLLTSKKLLKDYTNLFTFIGLIIVLAILTGGSSLAPASMRNLVIAEAVRAFAAFGVGLIILTRGIDLSIGFVVSDGECCRFFCTNAGIFGSAVSGYGFSVLCSDSCRRGSRRVVRPV